MSVKRGVPGTRRAGRKRARRTLKHHLMNQYVHGYRDPKERTKREQGGVSQRLQCLADGLPVVPEPQPATLADVWPQ